MLLRSLPIPYRVVPLLGDKHSKQCRAAAYRLIRHALVDSESVKRLSSTLDWYIVKLAVYLKLTRLRC